MEQNEGNIYILLIKQITDDFIYSADGSEIRIRCPLPDHFDSNPSFSMNIKTGKWMCFGCGQSGTAKMLADILDLKFDEGILIKEKIEKVKQLKNKDKYKDELKSLQDSFDIIQLPRKAPLTPKQKRWLRSKIRLDNFDVTKYPLYASGEDYIMFVVTYFGMNIGYSLRGVAKHSMKYINSKNDMFHNYVYLGDRIYSDTVWVVEGFLDALALRERGKDAVAAFGAHLTEGQMYFLKKKGVKKLILFFDYDEAGVRAYHRVYKKAKHYFKTYLCFNPDLNDPKDCHTQKIKITDYDGWKRLYKIYSFTQK